MKATARDVLLSELILKKWAFKNINREASLEDKTQGEDTEGISFLSGMGPDSKFTPWPG